MTNEAATQNSLLTARGAGGPPVVAGIGQCSLDFLFTVDQYPKEDVKCECRDFRVEGGGPVATALVALARWGVATRFCGVVCSDEFGREILDGLAREGVDPRGVVVRPSGVSQFAFICAVPRSGSRTIFWRRPEAAPLEPQEIPPDFLRNASVLHLDGLFSEASLYAARQARDMGIPVVLDAGSVRPGMMPLVTLTDHLICAEHFARQFDPQASVGDALQRLKALGPSVVSVTLGNRGSVSLWEDIPWYLPALKVPVLDTTGAGDVFHGGYIWGLLQGLSPAECLRWATVAAGLACRSLGGRSGIPCVQEVKAGLDRLGPFQPWSPSQAQSQAQLP